jgi:hypothetical protein
LNLSELESKSITEVATLEQSELCNGNNKWLSSTLAFQEVKEKKNGKNIPASSCL